jgi:xanthine dehydrogenase accessory factor
LFAIDGTEYRAPFRGLLRGLIREGTMVLQGMKVADIDPRIDVDWHTISDKARYLGGAALEACFLLTKMGEGR